MFNIIMFLITLICFFVCWDFSDKTGSPFWWISVIICGVACFLQIIMMGVS